MLFSFSDYQEIALGLSDLLELSAFTISRHENAEMHITLSSPVADKHCFILGTIAPPEEQMVALTLLAHTLKSQGAVRVSGILPYLAYARQDKIKAGESLATAWAGSLLKTAGIDEIVTIDVHSEHDKQLFPMPLISLSPAQLFAAEIARQGLSDATIVSPDRGAIFRCQAVRKAAGLPTDATPCFEKKRTDQGIVHSEFAEKTGSRVIIVDDVLDTGGTLVSACEKLKALGTEEIYIFVTHGAFTGEKWKRLWPLGVQRVFCTDTIPSSHANEGRITTLPVAPLLREHLAGLEINALASR